MGLPNVFESLVFLGDRPTKPLHYLLGLNTNIRSRFAQINYEKFKSLEISVARITQIKVINAHPVFLHL